MAQLNNAEFARLKERIARDKRKDDVVEAARRANIKTAAFYRAMKYTDIEKKPLTKGEMGILYMMVEILDEREDMNKRLKAAAVC